MKYQDLVLIVTTIFTALMAGFFFSYSVSVSIGLGKLSDSEYLRAMQSINKAVQNPIFFLIFFGVVLLLPYSAYLQWKVCWVSFSLLLAAAIFYVIGVFFITIFFNVPLNNKLDRCDIAFTNSKAIKTVRNAFEHQWNNWNFIRTLSSATSLVLVIIAVFYSKSK